MDSKEQLSSWVKLYLERLVRIAYMYVGDQKTAEDRVQDGFIKAYKSTHQLKNVENPFPWLVRIVINECKTGQRKSWREVITSILPEQHGISSEEVYMRKLDAGNIHNAVLELPEKYRLPIVLYHFEELPITEIADIIGINTATVKTHLFSGDNGSRKY